MDQQEEGKDPKFVKGGRWGAPKLCCFINKNTDCEKTKGKILKGLRFGRKLLRFISIPCFFFMAAFGFFLLQMSYVSSPSHVIISCAVLLPVLP
jgi:hypothetical protein